MTEDRPGERRFSVTFLVGETIKTKIESQNIKPLEAIALLEMAKDQMMNNLRSHTQTLLNIEKKD